MLFVTYFLVFFVAICLLVGDGSKVRTVSPVATQPVKPEALADDLINALVEKMESEVIDPLLADIDRMVEAIESPVSEEEVEQVVESVEEIIKEDNDRVTLDEIGKLTVAVKRKIANKLPEERKIPRPHKLKGRDLNNALYMARLTRQEIQVLAS